MVWESRDLYLDIEPVVAGIVRAMLLVSVESIVEIFISTMEHHAL